MVIGMGAVFSFLILLVVSLQCLGWFFERYSHLFLESDSDTTTSTQQADDASVRVAIALVAAHRAYARAKDAT